MKRKISILLALLMLLCTFSAFASAGKVTPRISIAAQGKRVVIYNSEYPGAGEAVPLSDQDHATTAQRFFVDGRLDRQKLGRFCFENEERTQKLNAIVHPLIFEEMEKQLEKHKDAPITVLDAPLLIESGLHKRCDKVMIVTCSRGKRVERAIKRSNLPKLEIQKRMSRQMPDSERKQYADYVISNNGTLEKTFEQVDKVLKELNYE